MSGSGLRPCKLALNPIPPVANPCCNHIAGVVLSLGNAMRRRDFISLVGGTVAAWSLPARAQQTDGKQRVSILLPFTEADAEVQTWMATFVQAFRELGWIDGSNVQIDTHWTPPDIGHSNQAAMEV